MKSDIKDVKGWKKSIQVEIPEHEVDKQREKVYKKYQRKVQVDGFRKGKVPRQIIERKYGDSLQADLVDELLNIFFKKAVEENDIKPISQGKINDYTFDEHGCFQFKAEVEVEPEIDVQNYTGLKLEKEIEEVTLKEVEDTIELLREQKAHIKPTTNKSAEGNIIEGDIQAIDSSGIPIIGEKYISRSFEIGKPPLGDILQDQLIGLKPGDEKRLDIPIPNAEKSSNIKINFYLFSVKFVYEKTLPELNEKFIKQIGNYTNIDEFKQDIRKKLQERNENEAREKMKYTIRNILIRNNKFELPSSMVERTMDYLWEEHKRKNKNVKESEKDKFKDENNAQVISTLKWNLISDKIIENENLTVSPNELEAKIDEIAKSSREDSKKIVTFYKNPNNKRRLQEALLNEKIMNFIIDNSKVKEVKKKTPKKKSSIITPG